jgi:predicted kinase
MRATLMLICGMVCAGKTTLAKALAAERDAVRLSPDEWLVKLAGHKSNREAVDRHRETVESIQWSLAKDLLSKGLDVILENGFWSRDERESLLAEARRLDCRVELHYLDVPRSVLLDRIAHRNVHGGSTDIPVDPGELDRWLGWFTPPEEAELCRYDSYQIHSPRRMGNCG